MRSSTKTIEVETVDALIRAARVLIVDDEFTNRKVVRTRLLAMGVTDVHNASDGASGLAAVDALDPDVVILDWQMAGMNGPDFVRRVRAPESSHPNVPIIMLTGRGEQSRVVEAMRLGVHEFLVKPVSGQALHERLASALLKPRMMARSGDPRLPATGKPGFDRAAENMIVVE